MTQTKPIPFAVAVGQQIRAAREYRGLTQDAFSGLLRRHGLGWNRSMLAKVERGEGRGPRLEELMLIAWATDLTVAELLPHEGAIALTAEAAIAASAARTLLSGRTKKRDELRVGDLDVPWHRDLVGRYGQDVAYAHPLQVQSPAFTEDLATAEEAEQKVADRLGVAPGAIAAAAHKAWGRPLSVERERRVAALADPDTPGRSLRALRGHVTRQLEKELAPMVKKGKR